MTERHVGTAHADGPDHFRLTCSCGWEVDPAPNNWDRWVDLLETHRQEARGDSDCPECHYRRACVGIYSSDPRTCPFGVQPRGADR